jgi:hypothetical protein
MTPQVLAILAKFLPRVTLQGSEVPEYNRVIQELTQIEMQLHIDAALKQKTDAAPVESTQAT